MLSKKSSLKNLKLMTVSFLLIFFLSSMLTFYWVVSSGVSPEDLVSVSTFNQPLRQINNYFNEDINLLTAATKSLEVEKVQFKSGAVVVDVETEKSDLASDILSLSEMQKIEEEIQQRVNRVNLTCQKYHLGKYKWKNGSNDLNAKEPPTPLYSYFFWNRQRHLAWCPVYKAGSTSWLYNMMILAGYSEPELDNPSKQLSALARDVYGDSEPDTQTLEESLKLLIVRHPFERLISAYRDKLANASVGHEHGTFHFYKKYGEKIVRKYRTDKWISQKEPTWEEFVRYLISTNLIHYSDDHWLPAYYSCTPCLVDYNIISKLETYSRDQKYIIYKAGLEGILKPRWNHQTVQIGRSNSHGENISRTYFSQLTKSQIWKLYNKYWFDFELFGYGYEEYMKYGTGVDPAMI